MIEAQSVQRKYPPCHYAAAASCTVARRRDLFLFYMLNSELTILIRDGQHLHFIMIFWGTSVIMLNNYDNKTYYFSKGTWMVTEGMKKHSKHQKYCSWKALTRGQLFKGAVLSIFQTYSVIL